MSTMGDRLKVKLRIKQTIEHHLYGVFDEKMKTRLHAIIDLNNVMTQHAVESFSFKGVRYIKDGYRVPIPMIRRLHGDLDSQMNHWLEDLAAVNDYERPIVLGYIQTVLNTSSKPEDFLILFPTALVEKFKDVLADVNQGYSHVSIDEAEALVKCHGAAYDLLKLRLMTNLLGVD